MDRHPLHQLYLDRNHGAVAAAAVAAHAGPDAASLTPGVAGTALVGLAALAAVSKLVTKAVIG